MRSRAAVKAVASMRLVQTIACSPMRKPLDLERGPKPLAGGY
jgi:hypothetical protein